jgi:hypothetical protein
MEDLDPTDFWEDSEYAREKYVEPPVTPEVVRDVEAALGFRLPRSYVALMSGQNGGLPRRTCFPTDSLTSWADDHIAITGFFSIGRDQTYSLLGKLGSKFMQEEWGYPTWGVCICDCPSAGHDMVMLDYRTCGPTGEPSVVHVDQEDDFRVTPLAPDFETFLRGLVDADVYDTAQQHLEEMLIDIRQGSFSTALTQLIAASPSPREIEGSLRALLRTIATEKGYFALHADARSCLVYDVLFDLHTASHRVPTPDAFLEAYRDLMAFGDGDVTTAGYAPVFIADWMKTRLASGDIVEREGVLVPSDAHREDVRSSLAAFAG